MRVFQRTLFKAKKLGLKLLPLRVMYHLELAKSVDTFEFWGMIFSFSFRNSLMLR